MALLLLLTTGISKRGTGAFIASNKTKKTVETSFFGLGREWQSQVPVAALHSAVSGGDNFAPKKPKQKLGTQFHKILLKSKNESLKSKNEELKRTFKLLDNKDQDFQRTLDLKDQDFQRALKNKEILLEEKDKRLGDKDMTLKAKNMTLETKDMLIKDLAIRMLEVKRALTCRGVWEWATTHVAMENNITFIKGNLRCTPVLKKLSGVYKSNKTKYGPVTKLMISAWEEYVPETKRQKKPIGDFCAELDSELSKDIHGRRWSGPSVKNTFSEDQEVYTHFIRKICAYLCLELKK